jgi:uncharacterized membrane protein
MLMSFIDMIIFSVTLLPALILLSAMPYLTRPTECFGISIPEEAAKLPILKKLRKQYAKITAISTSSLLVFFFLTSFIQSERLLGITTIAFTLLFILIPFVIYIPFHKKVKRLKKEHGWKTERKERVIVDLKFREERLVYSNGWFLIPLFISFLTILITIGMYPSLPERLPIHFDLLGNVTRYTKKSIYTVGMLPIIQVGVIFLSMIVNTIIKKAKQELNAANPEKSKRQNILFRRHWSLFTISSTIMIALLFFVIQLTIITPIPKAVLATTIIIILIFQLIWIIWLAFKIGQGGSRVESEQGEKTLWVDYDNDEYWKLGIFYFNRNDSSLFVEKRFGIGWTVNLARPAAWLFIAFPFLLLIVLFFIPVE